MDDPLLGPLAISTDSFTDVRAIIDRISHYEWDREGHPSPKR